MAWTIEYDFQTLKDLKRFDRSVQRELLHYLDFRLAQSGDPRQFGKPLRGSMFGLWRFRVRDYRIICEIRENAQVVLVVLIGHRSTIYQCAAQLTQQAAHRLHQHVQPNRNLRRLPRRPEGLAILHTGP